MWTRHHTRRNTGRLIVPAITAIGLSYFGFHAYQGDYGLNAKAQLEVRMAELQQDLDALTRTRLDLEERLRQLSDGTMERDMLDEQVRRALDFVRDNEIVILRHVDDQH